jgi:hypothetical protein
MEEWRPINDYPNYFISNLGRVKSVKDFKSTFASKKGYLYTTLYKNNIGKKLSIHRLVGIHFLPNWNNLKEIDHIDRDKSNNKVFNLRWSNRSDNLKNTSKRNNCSSIYKGVYFDKNRQKWCAEKCINHSKKRHLGYFETEEEAYLATQI